MNMNWLSSLFYGLISGFSEFLPISSKAHQSLFMLLAGAEQADPVRDLLVHIAIILSVYVVCRPMLEQLRRERRYKSASRNQYSFATRYQSDLRLVRSATLPMLVVLIVTTYVFSFVNGNLLAISGFLLLNGLIIFIPGRMIQGNKDSRHMSQIDGIFLGLLAGCGAIPGVSGIGCFTSGAIARGADKQQAVNWAFLLSIPALVLFACQDVLGLFTQWGSIPFLSSFFTYLLSAIGAYFGGYGGIMLAKTIISRAGFTGFAYYCWGASLLSFLLYLFAV